MSLDKAKENIHLLNFKWNYLFGFISLSVFL